MTEPAPKTYDLSRFSLSDMIRCGAEIRRAAEQAKTMEEAAGQLVHFLYGTFRPTNGTTGCALVRCFKTHPYAALPEELKDFALRLMPQGTGVSADLRCLALLATAGDQPEWNDRRTSLGHQAIPLPSAEFVEQAPMIAQLFRQLGLEIPHAIAPSPELLLDVDQRAFSVFHVPDAPDSPYVPAQADFVRKYSIASVLGFGGMLPNGDIFAVIMFSKVYIPRETADLFSTLALNVKLALLPWLHGPVFADE